MTQTPKARKSELDVFRVHAPEESYTRVYHSIIDSRELTVDGKMLIVHMLNQARQGQVFDIDRQTIARWLGAGKAGGSVSKGKVDKTIANAKACGFLHVETQNSLIDGKFVVHWYVTEMPGRFHSNQMPLFPQGEPQRDGETRVPTRDLGNSPDDDSEVDPPEGAENPMVKKPPAGEPPSVNRPAVGNSTRGPMVKANGFKAHGRARAESGDGRADGDQSRPRKRKNAVGGQCLANIDEELVFPCDEDGRVSINAGELFALYRRERSFRALDACSLRQFAACAARAVRLGDDVVAMFASLVNLRGGSNPQGHWAYIEEEDWAEADRLLKSRAEDDRLLQEVWQIRNEARTRGISAFILARAKWPNLTREEWDRLDQRCPE